MLFCVVSCVVSFCCRCCCCLFVCLFVLLLLFCFCCCCCGCFCVVLLLLLVVPFFFFFFFSLFFSSILLLVVVLGASFVLFVCFQKAFFFPRQLAFTNWQQRINRHHQDPQSTRRQGDTNIAKAHNPPTDEKTRTWPRPTIRVLTRARLKQAPGTDVNQSVLISTPRAAVGCGSKARGDQ